MANYIVLRDRPDWLNFDPETTRPFCRARGLPETTILDFIGIWNRVSRIDYRTFRQRMQQLSLDNSRAVEDATVMDHRQFRDIDVTPGDLVAFTGDDDWLAPGLFTHLRKSVNDDGAVWGSIRVGIIFSSATYVTPDVYNERPFNSRRFYTNNYAATGKALDRLGLDAVLEQGKAQRELDLGNFRPRLLVEYLSCTVRHPASEAAAAELMASESFRTDPTGALAKSAADMARIDPGARWARGPLKAIVQLLDDALRDAPLSASRKGFFGLSFRPQK